MFEKNTQQVQKECKHGCEWNGLSQCKPGWWVLRKDAKKCREKVSIGWKNRGQLYHTKIRKI